MMTQKQKNILILNGSPLLQIEILGLDVHI